MGNPLLKQQTYENETNGYSKKPKRIGVAATVIVLLVIFSFLIFSYIHHNQKTFLFQIVSIQEKWTQDQKKGLEASQLTNLRNQLSNIEKKHFGPVPAYWFPKWDGVQKEMRSLQEQTKTIWTKTLEDKKYQALKSLSELKKTEGSSFGPTKHYQMKLKRAKTPKNYENLANQWTKDRQSWMEDETKLKKLSGGWQNHQPADIVSAENELKNQLKKLSSHSSDQKKANQVLINTENYMKMTPSGKLHQHSKMKQELQSMNDTIKQDEAIPVSSNQWLFTSSMTNYIKSRAGQISVAVYDANNGHTYLYHPELKFDTASIVKVSIMADLLNQANKSGHPLTEQEQDLMVPMIENSSNSAASKLWNIAGGSSGIQSILKQAGMTATDPGKDGYWGLTQTTALDQVKMVRLFAYPNSVLDSSQREYGLNLMEHITSWENWGVSNGVPASGTVALKNGWLPYPKKWWINSIGYINGSGRNYVIAVLTGGNASKPYGIDTIDHISEMIWNQLGDRE